MRPPLRLSALLASLASPLLVAAFAAPATGELFAGRIDERNFERRAVRGPDAIGGVGDWALSNGTLCAVVSDPSHEGELSVTGGSLVDLGHCGRDDDQFVVFEQLLDLSIRRTVPMAAVRAEATPGAARLVARGGADGLRLETVYEVDERRPRVLVIRSRLERVADGERLFGFGLAFGNVYTLRPFSLAPLDPNASRGFRHRAFLGRGRRAVIRAAHPAEWVVMVGENLQEPGIAYGVRLSESRGHRGDDTHTLPRMVLVDDSATIGATFTRPFWWGDSGSLSFAKLLQTRWMNLGTGDALEVGAEIWLGARADVASVTDHIFADEPELRGRVDDPSVRLHLDRVGADGGEDSPFTQVRPHADGRFSLRAPAGAYRLRVVDPTGRVRILPVSLPSGGLELEPISVTDTARVALPRGNPMRLVFVGVDGTRDPRFRDDGLGFALDGELALGRSAAVRDVVLGGTAGDPERVALAPGSYRVLATRGPEYEVTESYLQLGPGTRAELKLAPPTRALETPGWIAADFHVHGPASPDTGVPGDLRLASYRASGAEVLISTDHDVVSDYGPRVAELGWTRELATLRGLEVTSEVWTDVAPRSIGHANAFPMPLRPRRHRGGAVPNEGRRWRDVIRDLRAIDGERVIQLNHPRFDDDRDHPRAFFRHLGRSDPFDPTRPLAEPPNAALLEADPDSGLRDLDFDAMELLNGDAFDAYRRLREDWFALLRQGVVVWGTANSDSHHLSTVVATPRNYVPIADDRPSRLDVGAFVAAIRAGRSYGTTGPLLDVALGNTRSGELFQGNHGTLRVSVRAAPWVPISELRVQVNGEPSVRGPITAGGVVELPLHFEADAFVTVEVEGETSEVYSALLDGDYRPLAFSNPIFVDADGDGRWQSPGLGP